MAFAPIAIVGRACVLPGALSPEALWERVLAGDDLTSSVPEGRWRLSAAAGLTDDPSHAMDRAWSDRGGYVRGFEDVFEPEGFGLPAERVAALDPLVQWLLHCGRGALDGVTRDGLRAAAVVGNLSFPSAGMSRWAEKVWTGGRADDLATQLGAEDALPEQRFMSGLPAALLAEGLGLEGGGFALDAACASALYALKLACDRLHDGDADLMLAGAVNRADDLFIHVGFCALQALSKSGRSRPFHAGADGLLPAEGCALFALKRLEDAQRDGDTIHGVIRGIGLSNDGRGGGILAPSASGQVRAMQQAWAMAGLDPAEAGLVECHATGTPVGDRAEIESLSQVFAGAHGLPIGSIKANMGHPITAAGGAGLLKLLGAIAHGVRPPTPGVDAPTAALQGTPLRLLTAAEPWEGPRRGAVSAFGFGGNNAHLVVEAPGLCAPAPSTAAPPVEIAVVALGARVADGVDATDLARVALGGESRLVELDDGTQGGRAVAVDVGLKNLRFPPKDLDQTLPQQLLVLEAAREAVRGLPELPHHRTGVFVGMGADPEVARWGLRWRLGDLLDGDALAAARDGVVPGLLASGVVGTMPNIPANRLNMLLDAGGPSFTVSGEELSGLDALGVAARALRAGELDAAVVGAADLSCEPVHRAALRALGHEVRPGDAGVALVLRRLDDARREGLPVLAVLDAAADASEESPLGFGRGGHDLADQVGRAHAADGLVHLAAAVQAVAHGAAPGRGGVPQPWWDATRRAEVRVDALGGRSATVGLRGDGPPRPLLLDTPPSVATFAGDTVADVIDRLDRAAPGGEGSVRLALTAADASELAAAAGRARAALAAGEDPSGPGVAFAEGPLEGELAFVFGGAGGAHAHLGRGLWHAFADLVTPVPGVAHVFGGQAPRTPREHLWSASVLTQLHARLLREVLGLTPDLAVGISSGETNALLALGAWDDLAGLAADADASGLFEDRLGPPWTTVAEAWGEEAPRWRQAALSAPVDRVREAVASRERVWLTAVHHPEECVVGGDADAVQAVAEALGCTPRVQAYGLAVHAPVVDAVAEDWRQLHTRPTRRVPGVRFVRGADGALYHPQEATAAAALLDMAREPVDVPRTVEAAWDAGARTFVVLGPGGAAARWIPRILGDRPHRVAALDVPGSDGVRALVDLAGRLWSWGLPVDLDALRARLPTRPTPEGPVRRVPAHWPLVTLPTHALHGERLEDDVAPTTRPDGAEVLPPAPFLPPITGGHVPLPRAATPRPIRPSVPSAPAATLAPPPSRAAAPATLAPPPVRSVAPTAPSPAPTASAPMSAPPTSSGGAPLPAAPVADGRAAAVAAAQRQVAETHAAFLRRQAETHERFLASRRRAMDLLLAARSGGTRPVSHAAAPSSPAVAPVRAEGPSRPVVVPARPVAPPAPAAPPARAKAPAPAGPPPAAEAPTAAPRPAVAPTTADTPRALPTPEELPGPVWDKQQLMLHSSGKISELFGPRFAEQDGFERQVRMPEPPLLLADRVVGLDAEPAVLGKGTIWTETDVDGDAWYALQGRMPAGVMIESGQADLMLISWMGIDFFNRSDRVYRLLGCTLTYEDSLPAHGDTIRYEIHMDGHAKHGDVRLMFFHYDCVDQHGNKRLSVRDGQAGFFTDEELDDSDGILWRAETGEHLADARVDAPAVPLQRHSFTPEQILSFANGRGEHCFGPGFEKLATHSDTPRIDKPPMLFFHTVDAIDHTGGPWGRGYLKATWNVSPDDWFFEGHFKNDPCMPGTLMFEGCLQALAFYMTSLGYTIDRDGWRFEPVPGQPIEMRCRGQVRPDAKVLTYEIFVEEVHEGPVPMVYADLLCIVDGLGAFHARRCGLRLTPAWPLDHLAGELLADHEEPEPVAVVDGFRFDYRSMLACGWGRPSEAFGPMYDRFDDGTPVPRLPGPPYHFISRATECRGPIGGMEVGTSVDIAWDIEPDAWFFDAQGAPVVPFAVLLEAALQPCGWLASYVGCALTSEEPLFFRNLDGTATQHVELTRGSGTLRTTTTLNQLSKSAGMIIVGFDVRCTLDDGTDVYTMKTVFGFFPAEALAAQKGLPITDRHRAAFDAPAQDVVDLTALPARFCEGTSRLADPRLRMIDRLTRLTPDGGAHDKGFARAEKDVSPEEWFFKAHFFQDPVQPGSLGLEALLQTLQSWMIAQGMTEGMAHPRFEAIRIGKPHTWKYRGQVRPHNERMTSTVDIVETGEDARGRYAVAEGSLWCDGLRIYEATDLALCVVDSAPPDAELGEDVLDPSVDTWVADHAPTFTKPALPLMSMVDRLAAAARRHTGRLVTSVTQARVKGWLVVDGPTRLDATVTPVDDDTVRVVLTAGPVDGEAREVCAGTVHLGDVHPAMPAPWHAPEGEVQPDPYASGRLFHGPAFQLLTDWTLGPDGAVATLDLDRDGVPRGALGQGLLDALTHATPHDRLHLWSDAISEDVVAYPLQVEALRLFHELPRHGTLEVVARLVEGGAHTARVAVQARTPHGVMAELELTEVLLPRGPLGGAPLAGRTAFLRERTFAPGVGLGTVDGDATTVTRAAVEASDWFPGTVASLYGLDTVDLEGVARREHAARMLEVHPSRVVLDGDEAHAEARPLTRLTMAAEVGEDAVTVTGAPRFDLAPVETWWRDWFGLGSWPVEDLYYALIERFVRRVDVADPEALAALRGRPVLFLSNHQTAIESLLFSIVAGGLTQVPTVTIAKAEHRHTWLGRLIAHCFAWPGARDPRVITFFDRDDKQDLQRIIGELAAEMKAGERSVMVHVEGTRSFDCVTPVQKMSGAFLDMALAVGAPIVPVRFAGGLPVEPLDTRTELPVGHGRQDIRLGAPILPETLAALGYKERKALVIDAINALGGPAADEVPLPGDPELSEAVAARVEATGADAEHAAVLEVLRRSDRADAPATKRLLAAVDEGVLTVDESPEDAWLAELATRLFGPEGPTIAKG